MLRIGFVLRAACLVMLLTACAARQAAPRVTPPATSESIPQTPAASAVEAPRPHVVFFYSPL